MPADILVVHLVSRTVAGVRSGWETRDGAVRHEVVSWRESPATLTAAQIVVAHGLAPLVVAQSVVGAGPLLVYRPFDAARPTRRRLRGGLHADWVAAPTRRIGRASASALGLDASRISVFRNDDRAAWDVVTAALLHYDDDAAATGDPALFADPSRGAGRPAGVAGDRPTLPVVPLPPVVPFPPSVAPAPGRAQPVPPAGTVPFVPAPALSEVAAPPMLGVGVADPKSPGQPWWMYRRMEAPAATTRGRVSADLHSAAGPTTGVQANGVQANGVQANGAHAGAVPTSEAAIDSATVQIVHTEARSGVLYFFLGASFLVAGAVCTQLGKIGEGPILVPLGALLLLVAAIRRIVRRRPDEEWIGRWLILGFVAKLVAALAYYHLFYGQGDQVGYDNVGRLFANAWLNGGHAPVLANLRETNFLKWATGVVYYVFGAKLLTGTFVFGLLALLGSYLWYRATVDSVPSVNRKLYLGFVLFAPSILFWPTTVGKEALMQFGLGVLAFGVSFVVRQRLVPGFVLAGAGGWLVWVVRPHLLALVAIAAGAAYLAGRVRKEGRRPGLLGRPIGIVIIAFLVAFTIGQGAQFLGIKSLSFNSIQQELNQESSNTANGNSTFQKSRNSLSPVQWPSDAATVFLRPFLWEIQSGTQILASLESVLLAILVVVRFKSLRLAFARSRESPFLMFCWVLTGLYAIAFSSFSNFGLLVRERSLVLPALLVLLSVDPALDRARRAVKAGQKPLPAGEPT